MKNKKPTRTHNPKWQDNTRKERQQKRRAALNTIAQTAGYPSWSAYETAVINSKKIQIIIKVKS